MKWKKNEAQNSEASIEKLADEVRSAAYKSMEALWRAFLEVGELDMVRATEKALRLLVSHSDIICFDWDNKGSSGPQDGLADHVGIVEKV